ncbi:MAG TPA: zf-HC2 domain-containing protein [Verrucomicrobiae bacterium]|nr:zf-HC2 domain-containing protein [Verrucomicrobiae bacterium]
MESRDSHWSDRELILAADGELTARQTERLRGHLAICRECRARAQELESAMGEFVQLHRGRLDPQLPPVPAARASLQGEIDDLDSSRLQAWSGLPAWRRGLLAIALGACILAFVSLVIPPRPPVSETKLHAGLVPMSSPMASLTPGVARRATREQVCRANQEKNRDVPLALRRQVFELYGIPGADPRAYEVDYLITPALGGSDDIGNLWPQSYAATVWNAHVKDALEDRLRELVCRGDLDLTTAQRDISKDWIAAYKKYFRTDVPIQ